MMIEASIFKIKNIRLIGQRTCELYMENVETASVKGWIINCNDVFIHQFHEQLNHLCSSENPFDSLLQLKQYHKVEVLC
ncbi:hypothetical protein QE380_003185 [Acinetobacter baylyi]|nr:hypothetical protein [Acinetobacter baylyi]MDQ1210262.1 hypothetical protein [Acinetobacter baylyi]MDR6106143.1 hypothetical protein [Acinetobacter baylyi]MDR6187133.1 hypothetical protein [Acinetobacter baylyi]UXJ58734.1 hypothetical protein N5P16_07095 [Acinetobacter baylyi]UXJ59764.1 hypothetical protein N5P13_11685 [Acinetobacter baylyi]